MTKDLQDKLVKAVLLAERALADYELALRKDYVRGAQGAVFEAADAIRMAQRKGTLPATDAFKYL